MGELLLGLVANVVWVGIGLAGGFLIRKFAAAIPGRRLWGFKTVRDLSICAATSTKTDTGQYYRPATGIGQVRALALVIGSLARAYGNVNTRNILLSEDEMTDRIESDLIILGGPKNNRIAQLLLDKIRADSPVFQKDSVISWQDAQGTAEFIPTVRDRVVTSDYGVVIRVGNPFSNDQHKVLLFSGAHTYGTVAAARFFTEDLLKKIPIRSSFDGDYFAVVSCDVVDGHPTGIALQKELLVRRV